MVVCHARTVGSGGERAEHVLGSGELLGGPDGDHRSFVHTRKASLDHMHTLEKKKRTCDCPYRCKYCGAKLDYDPVGHLCHTRNCTWEFGVPNCVRDKVQSKWA